MKNVLVKVIGGVSPEDVINAIIGGNADCKAEPEKEVEDTNVSEAYTYIHNVIRIQKENNKTLDDYVDFMAEEAKTDKECYCPGCIASKFNKLTDAEISALGGNNCATVLQSIKDYVSARTRGYIDELNAVQVKCVGIANRISEDAISAVESYNKMSREELIEELKKRDK